MKYLIVGLGNIGAEYDMTRHNIGFRVADAIAARLGVRFETKRYGDVAMGRAKSAQIVLLKPSTYMNLSGEAVRYWMSTEKIPIERVLVIVDDLALPFGALRLKGKGIKGVRSGYTGDLFCHVIVETPVKLTDKQKDLLREFDRSTNEGGGKHSPQSKGWMDKVKDFFE